jgi:hypothetical protein
MAGGLLNLVAVGNQNVFLTGNPKKTFFKFVYAKYTNFGLQRFRLDYEGSRNLNLSHIFGVPSISMEMPNRIVSIFPMSLSGFAI